MSCGQRGRFDAYRRLEKLSNPRGKNPEFFLPSDLVTVIVARTTGEKIAIRV